MSRNQQERLVVRFRRANDRATARHRIITYDHVSRLVCALATKVDRHVDAEGEDAAADYVQSIVDRLVAASTASGPAPSGDWAIDETGVDVYSDGLKSAARRSDQDARWGHRTPTPQKSMARKFFGYDLYGFTSIPPTGSNGIDHPPLIHRIVVRPTTADQAEASMTGIDSLLAAGAPVSKVIVDRGISYKADTRWAAELRARGIDQTIDMHRLEHGAVDHHGVTMIDGWPHCPSIPETLVNIRRPERLAKPRRNAGEDDDEAGNEDLEAFRQSIAARSRYAMRRTRGWKLNRRTGHRNERYECPAEAGQMRCPLKPHSMNYPADVPLVLLPPALAEAPAACTQRTINLGDDAQGKLRQQHRWGTDAWINDYSRRTYVEGTFGQLRDPALGGLARGKFCVRGLFKVTLMLGAIVAANNIARLTQWATRQRLVTDDPALAPTPTETAFIEVDPHTLQPVGADPPAMPVPA